MKDSKTFETILHMYICCFSTDPVILLFVSDKSVLAVTTAVYYR